MKLSPSLLSADFSCLADDAERVAAYADSFHCDVMDGHFVPNLTFGPPVVNALRRRLALPLVIHLMIDRPLEYAPRFRVDPDDTIVFHVEADDDPDAVIEAIRVIPARPGVTLRPGTPLDRIAPYLDAISMVLVMSVDPGFGGQSFLPGSIDRIRQLRARLGERDVEIAVDGGIDIGNVRSVLEAGADVIVAGSAIFGPPDPADAARALRRAAG